MNKVAILLCSLGLVACDKKTPVPASVKSSVSTATDAAAENDPSKALERLTQAVRKYAAEMRAAPKSLNEVAAAGYLPEVPEAPPGKKFVIDDNLRVQLQ